MKEKRFIRPLDIEVDKDESVQLMNTGMTFKDVLTALGGLAAVLIPATLWIYDLKSDVDAILDSQEDQTAVIDKHVSSLLGVIDAKAKDHESRVQRVDDSVGVLSEKVKEIDDRVNEAENSLSSLHITVSRMAKTTGSR